MKKLSIIGGGSAALMLAAQLDPDQYSVTIYEKKKALGRKFLVAGDGGLNLTYHTSEEKLESQYHPTGFLDEALGMFSNHDLIKWLGGIGIETFVGSSNRVFPKLDLKPIEVLNLVGKFISSKNVNILLNAKWTGWNEEGGLQFENMEDVESDITVFALGGASWKITGSDGVWRSKFEDIGIKVNPFRAANCAFEVDWNYSLISAHHGKPLKNIKLSHKGQESRGELVVTAFGLEGNAIYALSRSIQDSLESEGSAIIHLDFKPTMTHEQLKDKYNNNHQPNVTKALSQVLNLDRPSIAILKQFTDKETFNNTDLLISSIKALPIILKNADELDKAISTLGGIDLQEVDPHFQLKKLPRTYVIGEMLDWYAPTGGYLLQGCFSMGYALGKWLNKQND